MKVGNFKTQMEAPLSSRNKVSSLDGKEVCSGGLKIHRLTNQEERVIARSLLIERVEYCEQEEVLG